MTDAGTEPGSPRLEAFDDEPDGLGDFAQEHDDSTFAGETAGGLEHVDEPESPDGRAGMD